MKRSNIALSPPLANFEPSLLLSLPFSSLSSRSSITPAVLSQARECLYEASFVCTRDKWVGGGLSRNLVEEAFAHVYRNLETLHD